MGSNFVRFIDGDKTDVDESSMASVEEFTFHDLFEVDTVNGLYLKNVFLPEEVLTHILSFLPAKKLLKNTLVCKWWCNIIKSDQLWCIKYQREHPKKKAKHLPWYVYYSYFATNNYDTNFIKNGNGQNEYAHWVIIRNGGHQFRVEQTPEGADPLPLGVEEFNGRTSCFATSFEYCWKYQPISLKKKQLLRYIMNKFMPHIYVSEWMAGRFDCGCIYTLGVSGFENLDTNEDLQKFIRHQKALKKKFDKEKTVVIEGFQGREWQKVEILVDEYPLNVGSLIFEHRSKDTQFWAGHYGAKMAGGVLKILFDSIEPLAEGETFKTRKVEQNSDESEEVHMPEDASENILERRNRRRRRRRRFSIDDHSA